MRLQTSIAVIVVSVIDFCHGFALPLPTGSFSVGSRAYTLPRSTLEDPVAPNGTGGFILLNVYYPTKQKVPPSKYIWGGLSVLYDDYYGLRNGSIRNVTARTAYNAESLPRKEWKGSDLPTLIFSLPFAGPPSQVFHAIISDLVSYGYSVVTMDHPYEQPYLQLPDGTGIPGLPFDYDSDTEEGLELIQRVHEYRLTDADADAVLSPLPALSKHLSIPLNLTHFSFFGHSLSRSAALSQILYERNHTTAHKHHSLGALTMDGSLWGPAATNDSFADLRVPSLILSSAHHKGDPQFADVDVLQSSWAKEVNLGGKSNHTDFSNLIKVIRSPPHYKMKAERLEHNTTPSSYHHPRLPFLFLLTRVRSSTPSPPPPTHPAHHTAATHSPPSATHHTASTNSRATHAAASVVVHNVGSSPAASKATASAHRHTGAVYAAAAGHA